MKSFFQRFLLLCSKYFVLVCSFLVKLEANWHFTKLSGLIMVLAMQYFHNALIILPAFQMFFHIFLLKWAIKWNRFCNSSKTFEFSVFSFKWFFLKPKNIIFFSWGLFFEFLEIVLFTMLFWRYPTLWKSTLKVTTFFNLI